MVKHAMHIRDQVCSSFRRVGIPVGIIGLLIVVVSSFEVIVVHVRTVSCSQELLAASTGGGGDKTPMAQTAWHRPLVAVCMNASIDRTLFVRRWSIGHSYRAENVSSQPGGKGVNVARVLRALDVPVRLVGLAGGMVGDQIIRELDQEGISARLTEIAGSSRYCTAIVDLDQSTVTEVNDPGPLVSHGELRTFLDDLTLILPHAGAVILSGSLPQGIEPVFYATLIDMAWEQGVFSVLDATGDALRMGLKAGPLLVKPNRVELEGLLGYPIHSLSDVAAAARAVCGMGPLMVAVTLGAQGAVLCTARGAWIADAPSIRAINPVGSGDAFVAGFLTALMETSEDLPIDGSPNILERIQNDEILNDCLRKAVACGAANALTAQGGRVSISAIDHLQKQVTICAAP